MSLLKYANIYDSLGSFAASNAGWSAGGSAGAALGSMVLPGVGSAIGYGVGAVAGSLAGEQGYGRLRKWWRHRGDARPNYTNRLGHRSFTQRVKDTLAGRSGPTYSKSYDYNTNRPVYTMQASSAKPGWVDSFTSLFSGAPKTFDSASYINNLNTQATGMGRIKTSNSKEAAMEKTLLGLASAVNQRAKAKAAAQLKKASFAFSLGRGLRHGLNRFAGLRRFASPAISSARAGLNRAMPGATQAWQRAKPMVSRAWQQAKPYVPVAASFGAGALGADYMGDRKINQFKQSLLPDVSGSELANMSVGSPEFNAAFFKRITPDVMNYARYLTDSQQLGTMINQSGLPWFAKYLMRPTGYNPEQGIQDYNTWQMNSQIA